MSDKTRFYERYYTTHVLPRKGEATGEQFRQRAAMYQKLWRPLFPADRNARIIDAGCGLGSLVWWLQQSGYVRAEGIDLSAEQIALARQLGVRNVEVGEASTHLARQPGCYDVVILRDVLEHLEKARIVEILDLCFGALVSGGRLILQVPNAETPFFGRIRYGDFTHEIAFSASSLHQVLKVAGFDDIRFHSTRPVVTGLRSLARLCLWKPVETFYRLLLFSETGRLNAVVSESIISVARKPDSARG